MKAEGVQDKKEDALIPCVRTKEAVRAFFVPCMRNKDAVRGPLPKRQTGLCGAWRLSGGAAFLEKGQAT